MGNWIVRWLERMGLGKTGPGAPVPPRASEEEGAGGPRKDELHGRLYQLAQELERLLEALAHPSELPRSERYEEAVRILMQPQFSAEEVCTFALGDNAVLACVGMDALRRRQDPPPSAARLIAGMNGISNWARWILCELLVERYPEPLLERFLPGLDPTWQTPMARQVLQGFLTSRLLLGERIQAGWLEEPALAFVAQVLDGIDQPIAKEQGRTLRLAQRSGEDLAQLRSFARVLEEDVGPPILPHEGLQRAAEEGEAALTRGRGLLVAGPVGTGRSTLIRELAHRMRARGFMVIEASSSEFVAGQSFIGQLEGRLQKLIEAASRAPIVWVVPSFSELVWAGRHQQNPTSVLDLLTPHLEAGRLRILAEIEPEGLDRLLRAQPRLRQALEVLRLEPLDPATTLALAESWAARVGEGAAVLATGPTLREASELAQQFLGQTAAPGNLFTLLRAAAAARPREASGPLALDDLLRALARLSGLPLAMLDEREPLDLVGLRQLFLRRVLGQGEAVECLVQRVAMIKAGLVDPGRPAGVFLFTGPTGTGKTEIARTLAEFLFGSSERLVRVDMSEFSGPQAKARLLGEGSELERSQALVHRLREQPFAVVLLDEFEKADPAVWDLFLQVFDAGRLTDAQGKSADFRHAIFLLTSNVGADRLVSPRVGFGSAGAGQEAVLAELARVFRPEFLNRLDRVIVFRPLTRTVMRDVLQKELARVLALRGLRTRQWVVEWDESALDFLLEKGFSPAQGARPLRRAIERWFLEPLATTIVNREAPSGDQFLFVRSDGRRIEVVFVDPEASEAPPAPQGELVPAAIPAGLDLGTLSLDGSGGAGEVAFLARTLETLAGEVYGERWSAARAANLALFEEPGFWERPERFGVLSEVEFRERIEKGLESAERLLRRLTASRDRRGALRPASPEVVRQLAQQLYLLEAAHQTLALGRPRDAFLSVEALRDGAGSATSEAFARRLAEMYRAWAARRRMRLEELEERSTPEGWRWTCAIGGYGAFLLLEPEAGLHVLESDGDDGTTQRQRVRVRLAPQPDQPLEDQRSVARTTLAADSAADPRIVRRYREAPSPLVRDAVRGWRTGRIERVWAGDFDLVR